MDKSCPTCDKVFNFSSRLKAHLEVTIHCKKTPEEIKNFFLQFKKKTDFKCISCNSEFTKKQNLQRHINNSNCKIEYEKKERENQIAILQKQIDELKQPIQNIQKNNTISQSLISHLTSSQPIISCPTAQPAVQQIQIINNNHNENIVNNNLTINNTIIQHIYPLGYEKLPNISQDKMLKLLDLGDEGVIEIVKLVCEQEENKNFYKLNMNKNNISYLNNNYKIDICQDKELKDKLLKQCVILTYRMLISCSSLMTSEQIYRINSNLQNISQKMKEEIFDNGLKNIIEYELRNNSKLTKDKITKYTKELISNQEIKEQALDNYNKVLQIKEDTYKNKNPNIALYDINNKLGDPIESQYLEKEFTFNDFNINRYEYTTYSKFWLKRIKDEFKYINTHPNKTIGDITSYENRKNEILDNIEKMKIINSQMREYDSNNNLLVTYDNFNVQIANDYIKENERVKLENRI